MTDVSAICLLGFGEVGQILAADLAGRAALSAYDVLFSRADTVPTRACDRFAIFAATDAPSAVMNADLVISAVTAAQDLAAARSVADHLKPGAFFFDLNSCSPDEKRAAFDTIEAAGGRYVEAAVMSPFPPLRLATPMLLGGPHAAVFAGRARAIGFSGAAVLSAEVGPASATKMCRSVMIKGVEALLMESMLTARRHGVEKTVLASLSDLLPVPDWPGLARYMISRSLQHGGRRAEEMREAARTVEDAGFTPVMARAIVDRQVWAATRAAAAADSEDLGALLDAIIAAPGERRT